MATGNRMVNGVLGGLTLNQADGKSSPDWPGAAGEVSVEDSSAMPSSFKAMARSRASFMLETLVIAVARRRANSASACRGL